MKSNNAYELYVQKMRKIADVRNSISLLNWDKEVNLPTKGNNARSRQSATLSGIAHEMSIDKELGNLLSTLHHGNHLGERERRNVELSYEDYQKSTKYSTNFVIRLSETTSEAYHAWIKARQENDFSFFKEPLAKLVEVKREEADLLGYKAHPYDALMDMFEPGANVADTDVLFKDVREQLVDFVRRIREKQQVDDSFMRKFYAKDKQWELGLKMLRDMGYDFNAGRQDISEHPFTTNFAATDVRVTTRIDEHDFGNMLWSCIHEGGHALYEQGLPEDQYGLPLGNYLSLGIHESQSRLWENNVGRELPYWKANYPHLQKTFPENLNDVDLMDFYKAMNRVNPSFIRTESDELHYHFHILIRYEIEKGLIEGSLEASDLREIWNDKYKEYLGVEVPDDKHGVLQDIHWSHGSFGYFPTYSMGSFYAAQFHKQAQKDIPNLLEKTAKNDHADLLAWLREKVHQHGRFYTADELCKRITGEKLNFRYFMEYAEEKYSGIYGL